MYHLDKWRFIQISQPCKPIEAMASALILIVMPNSIVCCTLKILFYSRWNYFNNDSENNIMRDRCGICGFCDNKLCDPWYAVRLLSYIIHSLMCTKCSKFCVYDCMIVHSLDVLGILHVDHGWLPEKLVLVCTKRLTQNRMQSRNPQQSLGHEEDLLAKLSITTTEVK